MVIMKEYRQMPAQVESVGDRKATVKTSLQTENAPLLPSVTPGWATPAKMRKKC